MTDVLSYSSHYWLNIISPAFLLLQRHLRIILRSRGKDNPRSYCCSVKMEQMWRTKGILRLWGCWSCPWRGCSLLNAQGWRAGRVCWVLCLGADSLAWSRQWWQQQPPFLFHPRLAPPGETPVGGTRTQEPMSHLSPWSGQNNEVIFSDPTFETLSGTSLDMPEKSALSPKASVIPLSFSVSSREASAEMENFGMPRFTLLRNKYKRKTPV